MDRFTFGIGPVALGDGGAALRERFAKLLAHALDQRVTLVTARSYARLLSRAADGEMQLAWLPPALFVRLADRIPRTRLVLGSERAQPGHYRGALFVREDSSIESIDDLEDTTVAWVDPISAAGYLFPRFALLSLRKAPAKMFADEQFLRSHEAVVRAVASGSVDVGATYVGLETDDSRSRIVRSGWGDHGERMRALLVSRTIPVDVVGALAPLDDRFDDLVRSALATIHEIPGAPAVLEELLQVRRFVPVQLEDYEVVRSALNVGHLPILGDR